MNERRHTDWEAIECLYRAGQVSVRAIASAHSITEGAIRKKAKAEGWQRSLAEHVRNAVREKLVRADGTQEGTQGQRASDKEVIEAAAETGKQVIQSHRSDIRMARGLTQRLLSELCDTTSHLGEIEQLIESETHGDRDTKRRTAMMRAVSLPSRSSAMQALAGSLKTLVALERQAFNLGNGGAEDEPPPGNKDTSARDIIADRIARITGRSDKG
jgi:hypothetical protein